jgi:hypothetical protein
VKIHISKLRKIISEVLNEADPLGDAPAEDDAPPPAPDAATDAAAPVEEYAEQKDASLDAKLDAFLVKAETSEGDPGEAMPESFFRNLSQLLREADYRDGNCDACDAHSSRLKSPGPGERGLCPTCYKESMGELHEDDTATMPSAPIGEPAPDASTAPAKPLDTNQFASEVARIIDHFTDLIDVPGTVLRRALNYVGKHYDASTAKKLQDVLEQDYRVSLDAKDPEHDNTPPAAAGAGPSGG